jgi:hypothetical protein
MMNDDRGGIAMSPLPMINRLDFENALGIDKIRISQVIYVALAGGVAVFTLVVLILYTAGSPRKASEDSFTVPLVLSLVNLMTLFVLPYIGSRVSNAQLGSQAELIFSGGGDPSVAADQCIGAIRTSSILQLAFLDAAAFFGLTVSMYCTVIGVTAAEPAFLLNMVSMLPLIAYVGSTFPSKQRYAVIFESEIQQRAANPDH